MIQTCPGCGTTLDTSGAEPLSRVACPKCGAKMRVERTFDHFVLLETLGVGGMGTVYKARDTLLDRLVALKLLRLDHSGETDHTSRLQEEARVAASISHSNVIQVFSSGTDHGQFYVVMELVDHGSLDDLIEERKRLSEEQVLESGIQIAKGLRAAYQRGLVHRDVKPANILFVDEHTSKISDFGLAGAAGQASETRTEIWGTPYYVAPERLSNESEDFRSDIYSLGATLFHAVAGKAPIEGDTNSAVVLLNLKKEPLDLRTAAPEVSEATAGVLQRMIAPDPAQRFSSYDELVFELEQAYKSLTGVDPVDPTGVRRRRILVVAALLVVLIVGAAAYFFAGKPRGNVPAIASPATSVPSAELERQFAEARHQLVTGKHKIAYAAFGRIAEAANNTQPLYDRARLHEGLAALIARDAPAAQRAFKEIEQAGTSNFAKNDVDLANVSVTIAKLLSSPDPVPASAFSENSKKPVWNTFGLLLFALKDVNQLDVSDAIPLLERFDAAQPGGDFAWIADYKPFAQKYLNDCRVYAEWKNQAKESANSTGLQQSLERLRALKKNLKTHSALSADMAAAEEDLARRGESQ